MKRVDQTGSHRAWSSGIKVLGTVALIGLGTTGSTPASLADDSVHFVEKESGFSLSQANGEERIEDSEADTLDNLGNPGDAEDSTERSGENSGDAIAPIIESRPEESQPEESRPEESRQIEPVTVLNLGAEPRQVFRLQPTVNTQQQSVMTMGMTGRMTATGQTQPLPRVPATEIVMETAVTQVDEAGNRTIEFEYTDVMVGGSPDLPPEAIATMRSHLSQLEGLQGSWVMTEQGYVTQFAMTIPETMAPLMAQSLQQTMDGFQQMSAALPQEAIGIGAQWQMPYQANINGVNMNGVATYELVEHEGDRLTLAATVTQSGTSTGFNGLGLPENIDVGVQQINTSGQGIINMDLTQVMPVYSDIQTTSDSAFTISYQGVSVPVKINMLIDLSFISE